MVSAVSMRKKNIQDRMLPNSRFDMYWITTSSKKASARVVGLLVLGGWIILSCRGCHFAVFRRQKLIMTDSPITMSRRLSHS